MSNLLVTPILFQYDFLDDLCAEAAHILALDLSDETKYQQFKLSIFANFNRYLIDSILFLPNGVAEGLFAKLVPVMQAADEAKTLEILRADLDYFDELRGDFLNIIKTLKK
jgi:hypothetical protein